MVESKAWLAWLAFVQGDDMGAADYLDDVVKFMMTDKVVISMEQPFRVYFICCHLLRKLDPPQANQLSLIACQHLHKQAMKFSDESERRAFLEEVPDHRLIREEIACQERMIA